MSIIIEKLYKSYDNKPALIDISLSIGKGITGLLGPNGAGKSSLIKIICCYLSQDKGKVIINGTDGEKNTMLIKKTLAIYPKTIHCIKI